MSIVYRFAKNWDLVIIPNKDMSVSFVFWSLACLDSRWNDNAKPVYEEKFG